MVRLAAYTAPLKQGQPPALPEARIALPACTVRIGRVPAHCLLQFRLCFARRATFEANKFRQTRPQGPEAYILVLRNTGRRDLRSLAERLRAFEQQKARLADTEAKLKLAEKRARNRRLVEMGTLVEKAGLDELAAEGLFGALMSLRSGAENAKQVEQWERSGANALAQDGESDASEPIVLTFPESLDKEASANLRTAGFRFNKVLRHWEGMVRLEDAEDLAEAYGGHVRRVSLPDE